VDKYVDLFSVLVLQHSSFASDNPYILACAVIAASRRSSGICNPQSTTKNLSLFSQSSSDSSNSPSNSSIWPSELQLMTGLQYSHFHGIT